MKYPRRLLAASLALFVVIPAAQAWGPLGHSIVAALAQRHLSPAAEAEVERLLAADHTTQLADVASWPDQIQDDPAQATLWQQTRKLHYINFRGGPGCDYVPPRDCRDGECITAGLAHYVEILKDKSQSDAARLAALKFVVHSRATSTSRCTPATATTSAATSTRCSSRARAATCTRSGTPAC